MGRTHKKRAPRRSQGRSDIPNQRHTTSSEHEDKPSYNIGTNLVYNSGTIRSEIQVVSSDTVKKARQIIAEAQHLETPTQNHAIDKAIQLIYPYIPRDGQREALHRLIYRRRDLILIAKTSFGKSMLLQAVSVLLDKTITVVILPLKQIGIEQTAYIRAIGGRPCFISSETINPCILNEISEGRYTHVLLSPELAIGDKFRPVALSPAFQDRLCLVVVDEAHLVHIWGERFRTAYARLNQFRCLVGPQVPWLACSATLDKATLASLKKNIHFHHDVKVQRTSINRPEIFIRVGFIPKSTGVDVLRYLFSTIDDIAYKDPLAIPKTIVFFDTKREAYNARDRLRRWLQLNTDHDYSDMQAYHTIAVYQRYTHAYDQAAILSEFRKSNSKIRVICATEALGMGTDLPDVRRVVQYSLRYETKAAVLWQRGGRASRDNKKGGMDFLLPVSAQGPWKEPPKKQPGQRNDLKPEERRGKYEPFIRDLVADQKCPRELFLDHFQEPSAFRHGTNPARCCHKCNEEFALGDLGRFYLYDQKGQAMNRRAQAVHREINKWADDAAETEYRFSILYAKKASACFLSHEDRKEFAIKAQFESDLRPAVSKWRYYEKYGEVLITIAMQAYRQAIDKDHKRQDEQKQNTRNSQATQLQTPLTQLYLYHTPLSQGTPSQSPFAFQIPMTPASMHTPSAPLTDTPDLDYLPEHSQVLAAAPSPTPSNQKSNRVSKRKPLEDVNKNSQMKRARSNRQAKGSIPKKRSADDKEN